MKNIPYITAMDSLSAENRPFLFIIDFERAEPVIIPLSEISPDEILYDMGGWNNISTEPRSNSPVIDLAAKLPSRGEYGIAFDTVMAHLRAGDTWLCNLTAASRLSQSHDLRGLFYQSRAACRLWVKNRFLCFSPEPFVNVKDGVITTCPMKGTISADTLNAADTLLNDPKELAEHITVVDLLRNDISQVAGNVEVPRFRYIEEIRTAGHNLLQSSSEIRGVLKPEFLNNPGSMLAKLLPAGSVTGAPKASTVSIIRKAEMTPRGFYTGIAGIYDNGRMASHVLIRFIEQRDDGQYYRSGGGITIYSDADREYQELREKIYVPVC